MAYLEIGGQRRNVPPGEVSIGSDPASLIPLTGPGVSPRHAIIHAAADGQVVIRKAAADLEILINGVRLGPQPTPLLHGDKVQISSFELLFVDERRSGSTQTISAVNPSALSVKPGKKGAPTGSTGGRMVSLTDGREYAITGQSIVMGREASCDVVVTGKNVSRRHAEIMATPKGYLLVDNSTNGTLVNGERVQGQRLLARADVIRIGDEDFRFYADAASAPPAAAPASAPAPGSAGPASAPAAAPAAGPAARPAASSSAATLPPTDGRLSNTLFGIKTGPAGSLASSGATIPPTGGPRASQGGPLATLVARNDPFKGQRFPIRVPVVNIGRADYNDIVLNHDSVSTVHAKLQRREGVWVVVDLESTNGTYVDGERINGESAIVPGALLRFGGIGMMFESTDDTVDAAKGSSTRTLQAIKLPPKPGGAA